MQGKNLEKKVSVLKWRTALIGFKFFRAFTKKFRVCVVDGGGVWNLENNVNLSAESLTIVDICNAGELYF